LVSVLPNTVSAADAARSPTMLAELLVFGVIGATAALGFVWLSSSMVAALHTIPAWLVSSTCYALFILPVYFLHRRFSFRSAAPHRHALPRYVATQLSAMVLASVFSFVAYGILSLPTSFAALLVIGFTSALNFVVLRIWAFASA
jgi:putative flippase GtrA